MNTVRYLNLYAGLGSNRKLLPKRCKVTAVELNPKIAGFYKRLYPQDTLIVGDAHEYLEKYYKEFDFIWPSPSCVTYTQLSFFQKTKRYRSMHLWQEIIFLDWFFKGSLCGGECKAFFTNLFLAYCRGRAPYFFFTNFNLPLFEYNQLKGVSRSESGFYRT